MNKLFRISIIFVIILSAFFIFSVKSNAYTNQNLIGYVSGVHNINGVVYELSLSQKQAMIKYLTENPVSDAVATEIETELINIERRVTEENVKGADSLKPETKSYLVSRLKYIANKAGAELVVDTNRKTVKIVKISNGELIAENTYLGIVPSSNSGSSSASSNANGSSTSGKTLLYTGNDLSIYVYCGFAIIAIFALIKKCKV